VRTPKHIHYTKNKALKLLGFILCSCVDLIDKNTFISIYCPLLSSILDYGSIIWPLYNNGLKTTLEEVQNKFLCFLAFKCTVPRTPYLSYNPLLAYLNLESLKQHRNRHDLYFIYKL